MSWDTNVDIVIGFIGFSTSDILSWLVVLTILKSMSQWEGWHPYMKWKIKFMSQSTNQILRLLSLATTVNKNHWGFCGTGIATSVGFFTKKGNRETHRFHQWMISSLCFTQLGSKCGVWKKKTSTGNVFYSFLYPKYMQLFFHNPILGRKTLWCHQTRLENPRSECFQLWNSSARHVWLPSDNWALSIYNFPTKTFIILYLSRVFHFKEDVFPTIYRWC